VRPSRSSLPEYAHSWPWRSYSSIDANLSRKYQRGWAGGGLSTSEESIARTKVPRGKSLRACVAKVVGVDS
jgi:hypothetical protein